MPAITGILTHKVIAGMARSYRRPENYKHFNFDSLPNRR
jgi:hypothetical protein